MLEVEAQLHGFRARCHKVRAAERGQKIVERLFVRQVDHREAQAPLVAIAVEQVVIPTAISNKLRAAMRGGFLSSFSVPVAGILRRVAPVTVCPAQAAGVSGFRTVARKLPQKRPMAAC